MSIITKADVEVTVAPTKGLCNCNSPNFLILEDIAKDKAAMKGNIRSTFRHCVFSSFSLCDNKMTPPTMNNVPTKIAGVIFSPRNMTARMLE